MTNDYNYGVMVLRVEGLIAIALLLVGGFLMWQDHIFITPVMVLWGYMIQFFYNRRAAETASNTIMTAMQQAPAIAQPAVTVQPIAMPVPIDEQPAQPNAPAHKQPTEEQTI